MDQPAGLAIPPRSRIIDLTHPIAAGMPVYPGDPEPRILTWSRAELHGYTTEVLHAGTHAGTHMDAPAHVLPGSMAIDALPVSRLIAPGIVLDLRRAPGPAIGRAALEEAAGEATLEGVAVLLWTGWCDQWRRPGYARRHPGLDIEAAAWLAGRRVSIVAIDAMSIDEPGADTLPAHRTLLADGIPIVENLACPGADLAAPFTFVALPLLIAGAGGAPCRALAILRA